MGGVASAFGLGRREADMPAGTQEHDVYRFEIVRTLAALWNLTVPVESIEAVLAEDVGQPLFDGHATIEQLHALRSETVKWAEAQTAINARLVRDGRVRPEESTRYRMLIELLYMLLDRRSNAALPADTSSASAAGGQMLMRGPYWVRKIGSRAEWNKVTGREIVDAIVGNVRQFLFSVANGGEDPEGYNITILDLHEQLALQKRPADAFTAWVATLPSTIAGYLLIATNETRVHAEEPPLTKGQNDQYLAHFQSPIERIVAAAFAVTAPEIGLNGAVAAGVKIEAVGGGALVPVKMGGGGASTIPSLGPIPRGIRGGGIGGGGIFDGGLFSRPVAVTSKNLGPLVQAGAPTSPKKTPEMTTPLLLEYPGMPYSAQERQVPPQYEGTPTFATMGGPRPSAMGGFPYAAQNPRGAKAYNRLRKQADRAKRDARAAAAAQGAVPFGPAMAPGNKKGRNVFGNVTDGLSPNLRKRVNKLLGGRTPVNGADRKVQACSSAWWQIMTKAQKNGDSALYAAMVAATQATLGIGNGDVLAYCAANGAASAVPKVFGGGGAAAFAANVSVGDEYGILKKMARDAYSQAQLTEAAKTVLFYGYMQGDNVKIPAGVDAESPLANKAGKCPPASSRGGVPYPGIKIGKGGKWSRGVVYDKFTQPYTAADGSTRCAPKTKAAEGSAAWYKAAFPHDVRAAVKRASGHRSSSSHRRHRSRSRSPGNKGKKCVRFSRRTSRSPRRCSKY